MTRILDRLQAANAAGLPQGVYTWSQRVCEQIEEQLTSLFAALSTMPDILNVRVAADYTGTVLTDELPLTVQAYRYTADTDNTTDATWSFDTDNGGIAATITDGALEITTVTALVTQVTITSDYGGVEKSRMFTVYKDVAAAPNTGSSGGSTGGTSASTTTFSTFNSTSHAAVTDELIVTVGSGGVVDLSAPVSVKASAGIANGTYPVYGIWRWWNGATWVDVGTEVQSDPDYVRVSNKTFSQGTVGVTASKTGLTPAGSEKFKLYARNDSGTNSMYFTGTASAVSS